MGDGWVKHVVPHNGTAYLHNPSLNLVMLDDLKLENFSDRNKFVLDHGLRQQLLETFVCCVKGGLESIEVNHDEEMAQVKTNVSDNS